jgi:hypothetical protein
MSSDLATFLIVLAVLSGIPAWLTGGILKRSCEKDGASGTDWIPFGFLPYAFREFKHPHRKAVVAGYLLSNLVFFGVIGTFVWMRFLK